MLLDLLGSVGLVADRVLAEDLLVACQLVHHKVGDAKSVVTRSTLRCLDVLARLRDQEEILVNGNGLVGELVAVPAQRQLHALQQPRVDLRQNLLGDLALEGLLKFFLGGLGREEGAKRLDHHLLLRHLERKTHVVVQVQLSRTLESNLSHSRAKLLIDRVGEPDASLCLEGDVGESLVKLHAVDVVDLHVHFQRVVFVKRVCEALS